MRLKIEKGGVAYMIHDHMTAQDVDELIFGANETVIVSER